MSTLKRRNLHISLTLLAGLLWSCSDPATVTPFVDPGIDRSADTVVARVSGTPVYLSDVARFAAARDLVDDADGFTPDHPGFADVREEVINQRVASLEARREGLDLTDEARRRLALAEERILGNLLLERHLEEVVTETELGRLYDEQAALREPVGQVRGRHLLVATRAEAEAARARIEGGEDFADVAAEVSLDLDTAGQGGTLGWFTDKTYASDFTQVAFASAEGVVGEPVQTDAGWHLILVEATREDAPPGFDELRDELEAFLTYDTLEAYVNELRSNADVEIVE